MTELPTIVLALLNSAASARNPEEAERYAQAALNAANAIAVLSPPPPIPA